MHKATQTDEESAVAFYRDRVAALELELEALKGVVQFQDNLPSGSPQKDDVLPLSLSPDLGGLSRSASARLAVDVTPHDIFQKGPGNVLMAVAADKPITTSLCLVGANGMPLEPPEGLRVRADLHVEGDAQPLAHAEIVPCRRGGRVRKMEPMLLVSRGTSGVFEMDVPELQLTLRIGVYSSEVRSRKLCIRFSAVDDGEAGAPRVAPACSTPLFVMSRTPNSRNVGVNGKRTREKAAPAPLASAVPMDNLILAEATIVTDPHAARVARDLFGQDDGAL
jgi:hypothetical protein